MSDNQVRSLFLESSLTKFLKCSEFVVQNTWENTNKIRIILKVCLKLYDIKH